MRVGRLALVVATLVAILVFPLALRDAVQALRLPSAYAAPGVVDADGRVYQNGNNNGNDNDGGGNNDDDDDDDNRNDNNDESDNEGEDNDNEVICYENLNSNEEVPCGFEDNDNYYAPPAPAPSAPSAPAAPAPIASNRSCFSAGQTGEVKLILSGGSISVRAVGPGLPQSAWIALDAVDPGSVPTPPAGATVLDSLVWNMSSGAGCDGGAAGQVTGAVNLGIPYTISADKSKLQIVRLQGGQWVEVPTVPDPSPSNSYISATVQETGTYAVIQKP
jgi:hypothetical protein